MTEDRRPGARLERALEAFLAAPPTDAAQADRLLSQHPDLHDVLAPMLGAAAGSDDADDGSTVLGDFRLVREVGRGGMGVVFEAWQRSLDRRVAVKVLPAGSADSPGAVARLRREAAAAARLRHPNLVEVFGFGSERGQHFFAMQFVDGTPLHACMADWREPERAVALVAQLADALAHAHAHGVVHRDLKPGNVLIDADGRALLTDFGVARDESQPSLTRDGGFVGTLDYAAPEQLRGEDVDARADVWSLGVVLYELLAAVRPFAAATQQATMRNVLVAEPPSLRSTRRVSRDLAAIVDRALQKDRTRRYASAAALLRDLRALQRGEPVEARLPSTGERLLRWARREPWRAVAAAFALVAVPALAGVGGYLWANAPRIRAAIADEVRRDREERLAQATFERTEGRWDRALEVLLPLPAGDPEVAFARAWSLFGAGRHDAAQAALRGRTEPCIELARRVVDGAPPTAAELRQGSGDAFDCFVRAVLLYEHGGDRRTARERREATTLMHQAMLLAPGARASAAVQLAFLAIDSDDAAAMARADRILAVHFADNPTASRLRAMLLAETDARAALEWIDALPPDLAATAPVASARGRAHERLGDLAAAEAAYRAALAIDAGRASDWANLGAVLRKQRRADEAVDALQRARAARPQRAHFANLLALALRDAGRIDEAEAEFAALVQRDRDYAPAAYNLGNLRMRRGDLDGAIAAFRRAAAIEPDDVRHLANLGDALARAGHVQEALAVSLRAAERAPDAFVVQWNVARLALQLGLAELALPAARRAQACGGDDPRGATLLAEALLAQRAVDGPAALAAARAADAAHDGEDLAARLLLVRALAATGDRPGALELLRAAEAAPRFADATSRAELVRVRQELEAR